MDEKSLEMAEAIERGEREAGMARVAKLNAPQSHPDFNGIDCVECDEPIHMLRLAMGKVRCTHCQQRTEKVYG